MHFKHMQHIGQECQVYLFSGNNYNGNQYAPFDVRSYDSLNNFADNTIRSITVYAANNYHF